MDQDDPATSVAPDATTSRAVSEPIAPQDEPSTDTLPSRPHPLSMSLIAPSPSATPVDSGDGLVADLETLPDTLVPAESLQVSTSLTDDDMVSLDMSSLGPDGTQFEGAQDLSQLQGPDLLLGGTAMDESDDPFENEV